MKHRLNGFHEQAQYCHVQCFHKEPIQKLSRFQTLCPRCHNIIEANIPIEKYGVKWAHRGCKEVSNVVLVADSTSAYEQLLKASLIIEDELFPMENTDSQQTYESCEQSLQQSIDTQQFSQLTSDTLDSSLQSQQTLPDDHRLEHVVPTKRKSSVDVSTLYKNTLILKLLTYYLELATD